MNSLGGNEYRRKSIEQIAEHLKNDAQSYRWRVQPRDVYSMQQPLRLPKKLTSHCGAHFTTFTELTKSKWDKLISFSADLTDKQPQNDYSDGGETEFPEGRVYERKHKVRERNKQLVARAKEKFKSKHGHLFCEACNFDFKVKYGSVGDGFIEVHHTIPVMELKPGARTNIADVALVCSNCHRILHLRRPWLTIPALRKLLKQVSWGVFRTVRSTRKVG